MFRERLSFGQREGVCLGRKGWGGGTFTLIFIVYRWKDLEYVILQRGWSCVVVFDEGFHFSTEQQLHDVSVN